MVYFGTIEGPLAQMQDVSCMSTPLVTSHNKYLVNTQFENGGIGVTQSTDSHKGYALTFQGDISQSQGIDTIIDYFNGEYGDGFLYMADPALIATGANLFRRNWATPAIAGNYPTAAYKTLTPGYTGTVAVTGGYGAPPLAARFVNLTNYIPGRFFTIPVPEGHTLWVGARGESTNIEFALYDGSAYIGAIPLSASGSNGLYTESVAGPTVARFRIQRVAPGAGQMLLQSADAILLPNGVSAPVSGNHQRGQGVSGMKFNTQSLPYEYTNAMLGIRSFSIELVETEEWANVPWD